MKSIKLLHSSRKTVKHFLSNSACAYKQKYFYNNEQLYKKKMKMKDKNNERNMKTSLLLHVLFQVLLIQSDSF